MDLPKLLITSGMHGDEHEVVGLVQNYLNLHKDQLPNYVYIPHLSPTALSTKTRRNAQGNDLNRSFLDNTTDVEAKKIMEQIAGYQFDLALDFHEDPEFMYFYMYDSGKIEELQLKDFNTRLMANEIGLFTGIDDEGDPLLGFKFVDGYSSFLGHPPSEMAGTLWDYTLRHGITKRMLTLEIPGRQLLGKKEKVVNIIFEDLLPKLLLG